MDTKEQQQFPTFANVLKPGAGNRVPTAIPGLDPLIQGGLNRGDFILLSGGIGA